MIHPRLYLQITRVCGQVKYATAISNRTLPALIKAFAAESVDLIRNPD